MTFNTGYSVHACFLVVQVWKLWLCVQPSLARSLWIEFRCDALNNLLTWRAMCCKTTATACKQAAKNWPTFLDGPYRSRSTTPS